MAKTSFTTLGPQQLRKYWSLCYKFQWHFCSSYCAFIALYVTPKYIYLWVNTLRITALILIAINLGSSSMSVSSPPLSKVSVCSISILRHRKLNHFEEGKFISLQKKKDVQMEILQIRCHCFTQMQMYIDLITSQTAMHIVKTWSHPAQLKHAETDAEVSIFLLALTTAKTGQVLYYWKMGSFVQKLSNGDPRWLGHKECSTWGIGKSGSISGSSRRCCRQSSVKLTETSPAPRAEIL